MSSCLSYLWEEITPLIIKLLAEKTADTNEYQQNINRIFDIIEELLNSQNKSCELEHLKTFQICFKDENVDYAKISYYAKQALKKCEECKLCCYCTNCSASVYNKIIDKSLQVNTIPLNLMNYFSSKSQVSFYQPFFSLKKNISNINNSLFCLKGFSSSTPILRSAIFTGQCSGGGFYINFHGCGIVIDPGVGFVNLMHNYGISISDVDIVIITHSHTDHCVDAPLLSSLNYDLNRYYLQKEKIFEVFKEQQLLPQHKIKWILDETSKEMYKEVISDCSKLSDYLGKSQKISDSNNDIFLSSIRTQHDAKIKSYGIKIESKYSNENISIGYTSDTKFLQEFGEFYDSLDILIFNISDIYKDDIQYYSEKHSHLGYSGSLKLINSIQHKPKLALVSEFCCTNGDFRTKITSKLIDESKMNGFNGVIIPGEIGLKIQLPIISCQCTLCKRMFPIDQIIVTDSNYEYGTLQYLCRNCTINQLEHPKNQHLEN